MISLTKSIVIAILTITSVGLVDAQRTPVKKVVQEPKNAAPQTAPCALTPGKKLELGGFYLGMPLAEFRDRFDALKSAVSIPKPNAAGVRAGSGDFRLEDDSPRSLYFEFLDDKLTVLTIYYPNFMVKWGGEDDFYNRLAQNLGISSKWNTVDRDTGARSVTCGNYEISGQYISKQYAHGTEVKATIVDLSARQNAKTRQAADEAKKKASIKM